MAMIKEFKEFIMKGNVLDLAVALVLGIAFGAVVKSLVDDVIMPAVGLALGGTDFTNLYWVMKSGATPVPDGATLEAARATGAAVMAYGLFLNNIVTFVIIGFAIFMIVKAVNKAQRAPAATPSNMKPCAQCTMDIPLAASRCPHCTAPLA